jgi:segregation and condensation protein B
MMNAKATMPNPYEPIPFEDGEFESEEESVVVTMHPSAERSEHLRTIEAMLFAASEPLSVDELKRFLPEHANAEQLLADLTENYAMRGVHLVQVAGGYAFRTAGDMQFVLQREKHQQKKLSKAAMETLAIIAYHQPATRADIEDVRGVVISKGTLDLLLEIGWVKMRGRRKSPGRPVTYGTTDDFLKHFGLNELTDLPGLHELKAVGLLDASLPPGFDVPLPKITDDLTDDEDPLDGTELQPLEMHLPEEQGGGTS